jgi:hypothetical protein
MDVENINIMKLNKYIKDNGVMICGMVKDNILLFQSKSL